MFEAHYKNLEALQSRMRDVLSRHIEVQNRVVEFVRPLLPPFLRSLDDVLTDSEQSSLPIPTTPPPLTEKEQHVLNLIESQSEGQGISVKEIINDETSRSLGISQGGLTTHIIPRLKDWYGVTSRTGVGYYVESLLS